MAWYVLSETITFIAWHKAKGNDKEFHDAMEEPAYPHETNC